MIKTEWVGCAPKAPEKKAALKPLARNERDELVALRIFRESAIHAGIEAGEQLARQELRIDELQSHLATVHDVLFNTVANTVHLIPSLAPKKTRFTKPSLERMRRAAA